MKTVIVCAFDTYFDRVTLLKNYYMEKGNEVLVISSSFSHRNKSKVHESMADILIACREYKKNLSVNRLRNHMEFAKGARKELETVKPDVIHCLIPCNSLAKELALYKKEYPCILYFDLIDLWPETMPIKQFKNAFPFTIWKNLRDDYLKYADKVYVECDLYKEVLKNDRYTTLYFARNEKPMNTKPVLRENVISLAYLGSVNHIIDIDLIESFLVACSKYKKVEFHLIGDGESKQELIHRMEKQNIKFVDHGQIFDQKRKQAIFDICHYGFNVMKDSVVVGLTMKSLDYMCAGLPLINTIQGDTKKLCNQRNIGFHVTKDTVEEIAFNVCSISNEDNRMQRQNIKDVYCQYFTVESFNQTLEGK
ncbi:MAG: hypothetical protein HUJ53_06555 [Holdemanella sp.]|nr:hypothetical protein [Holdemanella sp.]